LRYPSCELRGPRRRACGHRAGTVGG